MGSGCTRVGPVGGAGRPANGAENSAAASSGPSSRPSRAHSTLFSGVLCVFGECAVVGSGVWSVLAALWCGHSGRWDSGLGAAQRLCLCLCLCLCLDCVACALALWFFYWFGGVKDAFSHSQLHATVFQTGQSTSPSLTWFVLFCSVLVLLFSRQVNVPKERRTYCKSKKCRKHTVHKVTQYKAGKASGFAQGAAPVVFVCLVCCGCE